MAASTNESCSIRPIGSARGIERCKNEGKRERETREYKTRDEKRRKEKEGKKERRKERKKRKKREVGMAGHGRRSPVAGGGRRPQAQAKEGVHA